MAMPHCPDLTAETFTRYPSDARMLRVVDMSGTVSGFTSSNALRRHASHILTYETRRFRHIYAPGVSRQVAVTATSRE
jgi:hypothetical protein